MHAGEHPNLLSKSTTKCVSIPEYIKDESPEVFIKDETVCVEENISIEVQMEGNFIKFLAVNLCSYSITMNSDLSIYLMPAHLFVLSCVSLRQFSLSFKYLSGLRALDG